MMGPAALLDYDRKKLRGLILEEGGPTSHVAIVARALGIATVGEIANATGVVEPGDAVIVDGDLRRRACAPDARHGGRLHRARAAARAPAVAVPRAARQALRHQGRRSRSRCMLNAGLLIDLPHMAETGAAGIGLFRTELQFMVAAQFPRTGEQLTLYRSVLDAAGRQAGDLPHPRHRRRQGPALHAHVEEENPALGWRAIRLGLDRPGLLRSQVRALLRAAAGRELRVMFPMVAAVARVRRGQGVWSSANSRICAVMATSCPNASRSAPCSRCRPCSTSSTSCSSASISCRSARTTCCSSSMRSIAATSGSRSASMRCRRRCCGRLRDIVDKGRDHNKPVTLCGELASQPIGALALIGLGYRSLSLSPSAVGPVKAMLLDLDVPVSSSCAAQPADREPVQASRSARA